MRERDIKNLTKVGFFIALLLSIFMLIIVSIGKENSFFESKTSLKTNVNNAQGLKTGAMVQYRGIKIGKVEDINILSVDDIQILMEVAEKYLKWIKKDSLISINTTGLVGDKYIEIIGGADNSPSASPDDILAADKSLDFKKLADKGESIVDRIDTTLEKLSKVLDQVQEGEKISSILTNLDQGSSNFASFSSSLNKEINLTDLKQFMANMNQTSTKMDQAMIRFEKIAKQIDKGPGSLYSLIHDDSLYENLSSLLGGANKSKVLKYFVRESIKRGEKNN